MRNRIDYHKMDNESFRLWLVYLKTHPIVRTVKSLENDKGGFINASQIQKSQN